MEVHCYTSVWTPASSVRLIVVLFQADIVESSGKSPEGQSKLCLLRCSSVWTTAVYQRNSSSPWLCGIKHLLDREHCDLLWNGCWNRTLFWCNKLSNLWPQCSADSTKVLILQITDSLKLAGAIWFTPAPWSVHFSPFWVIQLTIYCNNDSAMFMQSFSSTMQLSV